MQIISRIISAFIVWLNAPGVAADRTTDQTDWADLPTYHPSRD